MRCWDLFHKRACKGRWLLQQFTSVTSHEYKQIIINPEAAADTIKQQTDIRLYHQVTMLLLQ